MRFVSYKTKFLCFPQKVRSQSLRIIEVLLYYFSSKIALQKIIQRWNGRVSEFTQTESLYRNSRTNRNDGKRILADGMARESQLYCDAHENIRFYQSKFVRVVENEQ